MSLGAVVRRRVVVGAVVAATGVLSVTVVAGCGAGGTASDPRATGAVGAQASASPASSASADGGDVPGTPGPSTYTTGSRMLSVRVTGSTIEPAPTTIDLPVGQTLALTVTSDHADEVHAHGFDVEKEVSAGGSVLMVLTGSEPGEYEVEMHHPVLTLLKIDVR